MIQLASPSLLCRSRLLRESRVDVMKRTQLNRGLPRRLMYIEAKSGLIAGAQARIGWVSFSRSGRSVRYRNHIFARIKGGGIAGNYYEVESGREFWITGVKSRGCNRHPSASGVAVVVDSDAEEGLGSIRR